MPPRVGYGEQEVMVAVRHSCIPTSHSAPSHSLTPRALSFSKGDTSQVVFPLVSLLQTEQRHSLSTPLASWGQPQDAKTGEKRPLHQPLLSHWDLTPTSSSRLPAAQNFRAPHVQQFCFNRSRAELQNYVNFWLTAAE